MDRELIREIQEYLRALSFFNNRLLPLSVDGFFGDETRRAVMFFQQEYGLPPTGEVDQHTWDELIAAYRILQDTAVIPLNVFPDSDHVLRPGETTDLVPFLQLVLRKLATQYDNIASVGVTGVYDEPTVDSVRNVQRIHTLNPNGIVDRATWNVLARLYNAPTSDARRIQVR